jgi:hypothetical protein
MPYAMSGPVIQRTLVPFASMGRGLERHTKRVAWREAKRHGVADLTGAVSRARQWGKRSEREEAAEDFFGEMVASAEVWGISMACMGDAAEEETP